MINQASIIYYIIYTMKMCMANKMIIETVE